MWRRCGALLPCFTTLGRKLANPCVLSSSFFSWVHRGFSIHRTGHPSSPLNYIPSHPFIGSSRIPDTGTKQPTTSEGSLSRPRGEGTAKMTDSSSRRTPVSTTIPHDYSILPPSAPTIIKKNTVSIHTAKQIQSAVEEERRRSFQGLVRR
jgi:hypothetical protein